eukprot:Skav235872  [mRNA]  locus=scaffold1192:20942:23534:- [translate_table: standard]
MTIVCLCFDFMAELPKCEATSLVIGPQRAASTSPHHGNGAMAADYMVAQVYGETIEKEMKQYKRIREEQIAKKKAQEEALGIAAKSILTQPKHKSCQVSQLEQSLGHFPNPHPYDGKPRVQSDPQKILRYGVSGQGQGRGAYLKLEKSKGGPIERYGRALTTAQEIGWTAGPATKTYTSSPFAHRPLIESQFYRPMGVSFSTGAL